jgi:hypothetical protein
LFVDEIARVELAAGCVLKLLEVLPAADNGRTRAYLAGMHPNNRGRQYLARQIGALAGTRLGGFVLERPEATNNRKEGARYRFIAPWTLGMKSQDGTT